MSKRNMRHSIGPFHIGTRRDSFNRKLATALTRLAPADVTFHGFIPSHAQALAILSRAPQD